MAVQLTFLGETEQNNSKGLLFTAAFSGNYGTILVGDLLNLLPYQPGVTPTGILDPNLKYDAPLAEPPITIGVLSENIGGSYTQITPNAAPSLTNFGLRMFEPGGNEKATNAAYTAAELAGSVTLIVYKNLQ